MEKESNKIYTKENPIENVNKKLYPIEKEDREIMRLEKTCDILSVALKVELAITLVVVTLAFIFNGFTDDMKYQEKYTNQSISAEKLYDNKTKF